MQHAATRVRKRDPQLVLGVFAFCWSIYGKSLEISGYLPGLDHLHRQKGIWHTSYANVQASNEVRSQPGGKMIPA